MTLARPVAGRGRGLLLYVAVPAVIVLLALLPLLSAIGSSVVASAAGCQLDEGGSHACLVFGTDVGDTLLFFFVLGWLGLVTVPAGAIVLALWIMVLAIRVLIRRARDLS